MKRSLICAVSFLLLTPPPASAALFGLFGSDDQKAPVTDQAVADIQQAIDDERYLDAGRMLDQVLQTSGEDARLNELTGELALARGHADDALVRFKAAEGDAAVRAKALQGEGIALAILGKSDDAIPILQKAVAENPGAWRAWNALGVEFDKRHDWADAENAFDHAIGGSGGNAIPLNNRGFSRLSQNRLDEAVADFVQALQKRPDFTSARNNLRLALAMKGDYPRAVAGAAPADRAAVLNNAGYVAMLRGDYAAARDLLAQSMKAKGEYYAVAADNLDMTESLEAGRRTGKPDAAGH